tara:strand:- start:12 stop:368 length:357 start_codon:yes stop_codon:yes gene_type:complete
MIAPKELFEKGPEPRFAVGQLVRHIRYGYRGVIVAFDRTCQATDAWYQNNQTKPERKQPWYHVLVDGVGYSTYAAQSNLVPDESGQCIIHPWVEEFFSSFDDGQYVRNDQQWPHGPPS